MQQGGYLVATLQTCLSLIAMLDLKQMLESASEILSKIIKERDKEREFLKERAEKELRQQQQHQIQRSPQHSKISIPTTIISTPSSSSLLSSSNSQSTKTTESSLIDFNEPLIIAGSSAPSTSIASATPPSRDTIAPIQKDPTNITISTTTTGSPPQDFTLERLEQLLADAVNEDDLFGSPPDRRTSRALSNTSSSTPNNNTSTPNLLPTSTDRPQQSEKDVASLLM